MGVTLGCVSLESWLPRIMRALPIDAPWLVVDNDEMDKAKIDDDGWNVQQRL